MDNKRKRADIEENHTATIESLNSTPCSLTARIDARFPAPSEISDPLDLLVHYSSACAWGRVLTREDIHKLIDYVISQRLSSDNERRKFIYSKLAIKWRKAVRVRDNERGLVRACSLDKVIFIVSLYSFASCAHCCFED